MIATKLTRSTDATILVRLPGCKSRQQKVVPTVYFDSRPSNKCANYRYLLAQCRFTRIITEDVPQRVLDVRNGRIRLYEATKEDQGVRYACLSHCWGSDPASMFCTMRSSIESHKLGISWTHLPRTFQDAVFFTRRLGLGFLWIDSVCIIQDDLKDWQLQSADIATIYRNGYITVAATSSTGPEGGYYTRENSARPHLMTSPLAVLRSSEGPELQIHARRKFLHKKSLFPLLKRGWVSSILCAHQSSFLTRPCRYIKSAFFHHACYTLQAKK